MKGRDTNTETVKLLDHSTDVHNSQSQPRLKPGSWDSITQATGTRYLLNSQTFFSWKLESQHCGDSNPVTDIGWTCSKLCPNLGFHSSIMFSFLRYRYSQVDLVCPGFIKITEIQILKCIFKTCGFFFNILPKLSQLSFMF